MPTDVDASQFDLCRFYFEIEHGVGLRELGRDGRRAHARSGAVFERDPVLGTLQRRGDLGAVPTILDFGSRKKLRASMVRRVKAALGRGPGPRPVFSTDGPAPRGLVLVPRKSGCLLALRGSSGDVVKLEVPNGHASVEQERVCLEHLARSGMADLSTELRGWERFGDRLLLRTRWEPDTAPVTPGEWRAVLRERLLPRMFDFYASWGIEQVDAARHLEVLRRRLQEVGLQHRTRGLVELLHRLRERSGAESTYLTRCHGDLLPSNVRRRDGAVRLIDWGNSIVADLFMDLTVLFLYAHERARASERAGFVSPSHGPVVEDRTTRGAASTFVRHAERLTGDRFDRSRLAFHVLCGFATRLIFCARAWRQRPEDNRYNGPLLRSLRASSFARDVRAASR